MKKVANRVTKKSTKKAAERRRQRSDDTLEALHLQLDACRRDAALEGMVLSDEDGLLVAAVGDREACDEVAARLPIMGRRTPTFEGFLFSAENGWRIQMRRFEVAGSELYLCAIGGAGQAASEIGRGMAGASRILAQA